MKLLINKILLRKTNINESLLGTEISNIIYKQLSIKHDLFAKRYKVIYDTAIVKQRVFL